MLPTLSSAKPTMTLTIKKYANSLRCDLPLMSNDLFHASRYQSGMLIRSTPKQVNTRYRSCNHYKGRMGYPSLCAGITKGQRRHSLARSDLVQLGLWQGLALLQFLANQCQAEEAALEAVRKTQKEGSFLFVFK